MNHELYELYPDMQIVKRIKQQRMRWLGHVVRMEDNAPTKKVFEDNYCLKLKKGRPMRTQVEKEVKNLCILNWKTHAEKRSV